MDGEVSHNFAFASFSK